MAGLPSFSFPDSINRRGVSAILILFCILTILVGIVETIAPFFHNIYTLFYHGLIGSLNVLFLSCLIAGAVLILSFSSHKLNITQRLVFILPTVFLFIKLIAVLKIYIVASGPYGAWSLHIHIFQCMCISIFLLIVYCSINGRQIAIHKAFINFIIVLAIIQASFAIYESVLWSIGKYGHVEMLPWTKNLYYLHDGLEFNHFILRPTGTFNSPNSLMFLLAISAPLILGRFMSCEGRRTKILNMIMFIVVMGASILTFSRGGWLGLSVGCLFLLYGSMKPLRRRTIIIMCSAALFLFAIMLSFPSVRHRVLSYTDLSDKSISNRVIIWQDSFRMLLDYPILGVGAGPIEPIFRQYISDQGINHYHDTHSTWLNLLVEHGMLGFAVFLGIIFISFKGTVFSKRKNPFHLSTSAAILAALVTGIFDHFFWLTYFIMIFWVILAIQCSGMFHAPDTKA
jgi:O-antigen ligase